VIFSTDLTPFVRHCLSRGAGLVVSPRFSFRGPGPKNLDSAATSRCYPISAIFKFPQVAENFFNHRGVFNTVIQAQANKGAMTWEQK
jgi:hypothetical protein